MRWTIPTLVQVLVDAGVKTKDAATIVWITYPTTRGDTFYQSDFDDPKLGHALGVYALWNANRADRVDVGGTRPSDDARTIAQLLRLNPTALNSIVYAHGRTDAVVTDVVEKTIAAIQRGDHFEPATIPDDNDPHIAQQIATAIRNADGAWDSLAAIPLPRFQ